MVPKVPYRFDIAPIGHCLTLQNIEFIHNTLYRECIEARTTNHRTKEFHAALQTLTQILNIIREMATSDLEINKKNAVIL